MKVANPMRKLSPNLPKNKIFRGYRGTSNGRVQIANVLVQSPIELQATDGTLLTVNLSLNLNHGVVILNCWWSPRKLILNEDMAELYTKQHLENCQAKECKSSPILVVYPPLLLRVESRSIGWVLREGILQGIIKLFGPPARGRKSNIYFVQASGPRLSRLNWSNPHGGLIVHELILFCGGGANGVTMAMFFLFKELGSRELCLCWVGTCIS